VSEKGYNARVSLQQDHAGARQLINLIFQFEKNFSSYFYIKVIHLANFRHKMLYGTKIIHHPTAKNNGDFYILDEEECFSVLEKSGEGVFYGSKYSSSISKYSTKELSCVKWAIKQAKEKTIDDPEDNLGIEDNPIPFESFEVDVVFPTEEDFHEIDCTSIGSDHSQEYMQTLMVNTRSIKAKIFRAFSIMSTLEKDIAFRDDCFWTIDTEQQIRQISFISDDREERHHYVDAIYKQSCYYIMYNRANDKWFILSEEKRLSKQAFKLKVKEVIGA
jgi:hypothetical protein